VATPVGIERPVPIIWNNEPDRTPAKRYLNGGGAGRVKLHPVYIVFALFYAQSLPRKYLNKAQNMEIKIAHFQGPCLKFTFISVSKPIIQERPDGIELNDLKNEWTRRDLNPSQREGSALRSRQDLSVMSIKITRKTNGLDGI
jgi:hypothetical protein